MIKDRLSLLRKKMTDHHIDCYIIPTNDYHMSEYVSDYFKCREYMSGFTGSAGTLLVTRSEALLWTDGRYFIQADDQLKDSSIELCRIGQTGVPSIDDYLRKTLKKGECLGFDGRVVSVTDGTGYERIIRELNGCIRSDLDLVNDIWTDRPPINSATIYRLSDEYTGETTAAKLEKLRRFMKQYACDYSVITSLDDIAWLLNLRGNDIPCNPVFLSYLLISENSGVLFCIDGSVSDETTAYLDGLSISVQDYGSIENHLRTLPEGTRFMYNTSNLNYSLYNIIGQIGEPVAETGFVASMKARKNSVEIKNLRQANILDGVAVSRFLCRLDDMLSSESRQLTELSVSAMLEEFRKQSPAYVGPSFETISAYGAHGAIVHYEPTPETDIQIGNDSFLLIDSGGQYLEGTTDITRTIAVGELTDDMKENYTDVLRGNLALCSAVFPKGISGANLDILARGALWKNHLDYNHGTGHGIGYFLNVHEGPQNLHWRIGPRKGNSLPLAAGMLVSDEPGIYIENRYGIRIENDILVYNDISNEFGEFLRFEIMTLAPIDKRPIIKERMTQYEISVFNEYHRTVYEKLSPYLNEHEKKWLKKATCEL